MTQGNGYAAQAVKNEPAYRRGFQTDGYRPLKFKKIPVEKADQAWRSLVGHGIWSLTTEPVIKEALGVGKGRAVLLRRAFDVMGLLDDHPGEWLEEWLGYNIPARIMLHTLNPDAFSSALPYETTALVVSTINGLPSQPGDNSEQSSLRSEGAPASDQIYMRTRNAVLVGPTFVSRVGDPLTSSSYLSPDGETSWSGGEWVEVAPPRPLYFMTGSTAHSAKPTPASCLLPETFTMPEAMAAMDCSRATANRVVKRWLQQGLVEKVARGLYRQKKVRLTLLSNPS